MNYFYISSIDSGYRFFINDCNTVKLITFLSTYVCSYFHFSFLLFPCIPIITFLLLKQYHINAYMCALTINPIANNFWYVHHSETTLKWTRWWSCDYKLLAFEGTGNWFGPLLGMYTGSVNETIPQETVYQYWFLTYDVKPMSPSFGYGHLPLHTLL